MLRLDTHKSALKSKADEVLGTLTTNGRARVWVSGPTGAGRHWFVDRLKEDSRVVSVELPDVEHHDVAIHGLVQAAAQIGSLDDLLVEIRNTPNAAVAERAAALAEHLADAGKVLVVLLPLSWERDPGDDDESEVSRERAEGWLAGLLQHPRLSVGVVTGQLAAPPQDLQGATPFRLKPPIVGPDDIDSSLLSGPFRDAADAVMREQRRTHRHSVPIELRLRVGLVALGLSAKVVANKGLDALARELAVQLGTRPALATAVRRFLVARWPILATEVAAVSGVTDEMLPLLSMCIGYGDKVIRTAERTRRVLSDLLLTPRSPGFDPSVLAEGHRELAQYHAGRDGEVRLDGRNAVEALHWLEKVYHLARGGTQTEADWAKQDLLDRGQYWERARYLSREAHRYAEAAKLYSDCIIRFGEDAYSRHYLAFNLDRARASRAEVRTNYARAVEMEKANPWWNARLVTFLIAHGTLKEAKDAWLDARERVDPTGERVEASPWLALHMHRWVARRWLALGHVTEARAVLDEIPARWIDEGPLAELRQLVEDHEEALRLGESVYPANVPIDERWKDPSVIPSVNAKGKPLQYWWPGRVLDAHPDRVTVVLADPQTMEAQSATFSRADWLKMTGEAPAQASGFIVLGEYEGGDRMIRRVPNASASALDNEYQYLTADMKPWLR